MNKKSINIFLAATIMVLGGRYSAIAQNDNGVVKPVGQKGNFMFGITGGLSAPSGNFTSTDYGDINSGFNIRSGFGGSGYNIGVSGTWFLGKNFGLSALVSYHHYSFKGLQNMVLGTQDAFDVDSASVTVKGSNHTINVLVGPTYSIPLSDKLFIDVRALGGLVAATYAGNDIWLEDSGNLFNFSQKESNATTFGFQGGIGLRYNFSTHFGVMLNADYFYSKPDFSIENVNRNNTAGRWLTSYSEPIAGINANLSLVYILKH